MKQLLLLCFFSFLFMACGEKTNTQTSLVLEKNTQTKTNCEWCGAMDAPKNLSWKTTIASKSEPGERMVLTGTIYQPDGSTPASNVLIYAYHTNAEGKYPKKGNEKGNGSRHGYLRGWMRTNDQGNYQISTIRPEAYPTRSEPAHVHMTIASDTIREYWIASTLFQGDPLITSEVKNSDPRSGGLPYIIELTKDANGVWMGNRDIILNPTY
jgi:protocatechuate 3,4-dioxygenase beta subunit